jgi:iron complex transport system substrate-binding protein
MRKLLPLLLSLILLAGCAQQPAEPSAPAGISFQDDTGASVSLNETPGTVAVLTSSLADLWITAGGTVDITVGETVDRGFVSGDVILVDEGAGKTINAELLIAAKPDLVIYSTELSGQLECAEVLHAAGIPAAGFAVETFGDYLELLKIATDILGTPERYEEHGIRLQETIGSMISAAQSQKSQPSLLFVRAGSSAKYTKAKTAENHFVCRMLKDLGTFNIAEQAPILLDGLSTEEILLSDPDAILFTTMGDESAGTAYMESLVTDPVWQTLTAVKTGNVHPLPKELFQYKPNARWDEAYAYLIQLLYGDII